MHTRVIGAFVFCGPKRQISFWKIFFWKKEKVNPVSGCLPMLLQMPVFISLYWVLMESIEIRHAPWLLWIEDLSAMDPYFVLPLLMGLGMIMLICVILQILIKLLKVA